MTSPSDPVHLAAACDEKYAMPLAVMLASVVANLGAGRSVCAYVLESALTADTRDRVARSFRSNRIELQWLTVEAGRLADLKGTLRSFDTVSVEAYYRLLLPELLPQSLDKVIYLDCDLVVNRDLGELWDLDVSATSLLAVPELVPGAEFVSSRAGIRLHRELGLAPDLRYFNSGVMVINLLRWRARQVSQRALTYIREAGQHLRWHDQEALNAVLAGEWTAIDSRWNVSMHAYRGRSNRRDPAISADPFIVHYNSAIKPWQYGFSFGPRELFFRHLDTTEWSGWRPARPDHPALTLWTARVVRALRKRSHAVGRVVRQALTAVRGWLTLRAPLRELRGRVVPATREPELRVLMAMDRVPPQLPELLQRYLSGNADRILIAVGDPDAAALDSAMGANGRLHMFKLAEGLQSRDATLRRLLHRYGKGHWCVLVDGDELLLYPHADVLSLRDLCSYLDSAGFEALDCHVVARVRRDGVSSAACRAGADAPVIPAPHCVTHEHLRTLVSDPICGRAFAASICVAKTGARIGELKCCSRVALLKYRPGVLIGRELRAVHGERVADLHGVVMPYCGSGEAPAGPSTAGCGSSEPAPADTRTQAETGSRRPLTTMTVDELSRLGLVCSSPALDAFVRTTLDARTAH
jgi:lipopolysaccharide biosynthesis glycosyltransferase